MDAQSRITEMVTPSLEAMGYELVRVQISGNQRPVLQIMAERKDGAAMSVEDCADISRTVSALMDVEDPLPNAYTLEVSSPGIDRPLMRPRDYARFVGFEARVETVQPVEGRKRFRGRLLGIDEQEVLTIACDEGEFSIPFGTIARGKLLLTDDLIAASVRDQGKH